MNKAGTLVEVERFFFSTCLICKLDLNEKVKLFYLLSHSLVAKLNGLDRYV